MRYGFNEIIIFISSSSYIKLFNFIKTFKLDDWIEITISSRKSIKARRIDELIDRLQKNDTLVVFELSSLGRSVGEVASIVDQLIHKNINLIYIKENNNLSSKYNIQ